MANGRSVALRVAAALAATLGAASVPGVAQAPPKSALFEGNPSLAKVSSHLLEVRRQLRADRAEPEVAAAVPLARLEAGRVAVEVRLEELTPALLAQLESFGLAIATHSVRWARVSGRLDPERLDELAALPEVATVHPQYGYVTRVGSVENQADETMNSDAVDGARSLGYDGGGVEIGILSDSFRDLSAGSVSGTLCDRTVTGTASQLSGDSPASVRILDDGPGGRTDEGRAISELMLDIAPGAAHAFHSASNSEADFADGITELESCGADVIVDDVQYFAEPIFQDGAVAQAAQAAVDMGVAYFSAAGNSATFGVNDPYVDANGASDDTAFPPSGDDLHDFDPGAPLDAFAAIEIPDDCGILAVLQWSEPFDGTLGPGAASDLDLYLLSSAMPPPSLPGNILTGSATIQGCGLPLPPGGDPLEILAYTNNTGGTQTTFLAVEHFCGSEDLELRIATFATGTGCGFPGAYDFEDGGAGETAIFVDPQIYGHAAAEGVVAVAASFYGEIDTGGAVDPPPGVLNVEPFSSLGGLLSFYFDGSGNPLAPATGGPGRRDGPPAPQTRSKPEITAPDGTNNSFFGMDDPFDADFDPNFFGTSASAPHAAAVAALMQDAADNELDSVPLSQLLRQAALDIESPSSDDLSGDGFIEALDAVGTLQDPFASSPFLDDLEFDLDGGSFLRPGATGTVKVRAKTLFLEDGDFTGMDAFADEVIFADGFESGDTSAWSN